jgi:prepilin-type N-terminal cleavage/methylation domain-containing protein
VKNLPLQRGLAFTLIELMLVLVLISLLFGIALFTIVQISKVVKRTTVVASRRLEVMKASEQIRWQLRCLYLAAPTTDSGTANSTQASDTGSTPSQETRPGYLGLPGAAIYGQLNQTEGQDFVLLVTSNPRRRTGIVEAGYRTDSGGLYYRQFPARDSSGFHPQTDYQEAPWTLLSASVKSMKLEYAKDGKQWQNYWDVIDLPQRIRVQLESSSGEATRFEVAPAQGAPRW